MNKETLKKPQKFPYCFFMFTKEATFFRFSSAVTKFDPENSNFFKLLEMCILNL